jgi:hypothetical protein
VEIPEALKRYNTLTDAEQQARALEIAETIQRLAAAGLLGNTTKER